MSWHSACIVDEQNYLLETRRKLIGISATLGSRASARHASPSAVTCGVVQAGHRQLHPAVVQHPAHPAHGHVHQEARQGHGDQEGGGVELQVVPEPLQGVNHQVVERLGRLVEVVELVQTPVDWTQVHQPDAATEKRGEQRVRGAAWGRRGRKRYRTRRSSVEV